MASLLKSVQRGLLCSKQISKLITINNARLASGAATQPPADSKNEKKDVANPKGSYFADPWDVLYGNERFEIAMKHKGFNDPYDMEAVKMLENSTPENPNVIMTLDERRLVSCICTEEATEAIFMVINKGETKRCDCGHWFKCKEREIPDLSEYGFVKDSGHGHH